MRTFQTPHGQINMREARVEEVEHLSDSDSEERDSEQPDLTIGIFPNNSGPTYLLCPGKQVTNAKNFGKYILNDFIVGKRCLVVPFNCSKWLWP